MQKDEIFARQTGTTIFGKIVSFYMYGRLHAIPLTVGGFLYSLHAALVKHRKGRESMASREIKLAFVPRASGGFENSWNPGNMFDKHGDPFPRDKVEKKSDSNRSGTAAKPDYKTIEEGID